MSNSKYEREGLWTLHYFQQKAEYMVPFALSFEDAVLHIKRQQKKLKTYVPVGIVSPDSVYIPYEYVEVWREMRWDECLCHPRFNLHPQTVVGRSFCSRRMMQYDYI